MAEKNKAQKNSDYETLARMTKMDVLNGLSSALSAAKKELDERDIDLDKGDVHKNREGMQGFNVFFIDKQMVVKYHTPVRVDEIETQKFEAEVEDGIEDVVSLLKRHYKEITGKSISLSKEEGGPVIKLEAGSLKNAWVICTQRYNIDSLD